MSAPRWASGRAGVATRISCAVPAGQLRLWVGQFVVRLAVFVPLYLAGAVYALGIARLVLTWPLVAATLVLSWPVLRGALPPGHPGLLHPRGPQADGGPPYSGPRHPE